jgi:hypothetical protein
VTEGAARAADRRERAAGDHQPPVAAAPQHHPVQGGDDATALYILSLSPSDVALNASATPQVILTPTHLAIAMEYASGGELFERICSAGRFNEDEVPFNRSSQ